MPVLPVPQVSPMWDEKGGGAGGEAEGEQVMIDQNYDQGLGMKMMMIVFRGQNGEDEVESTSLGPGDMPTGCFFYQGPLFPTFHDMPTLNVTFSLKYWLKKDSIFYKSIFSDRILEAEKICDKHEMEQFPNDADDIQVGEMHDIQALWFRFMHNIYRRTFRC